jgi:hypothetical protein
MKTRTIAIAGSIAALAFAATPVAAVAATTHHGGTSTVRVDTSRDLRGVRHLDRTPDKSSSTDRSADRSVDVRDR